MWGTEEGALWVGGSMMKRGYRPVSISLSVPVRFCQRPCGSPFFPVIASETETETAG
jgi:hypothetical protein